MDYEKKYNNALDRAKHAIEDCGGNQGRKEMIYGIFPELKEDKQEVIIKRIKLCLEESVHAGTIRDYEAEEAVAWIEKHKEQKPAEWSENDRDKIAEYLHDRGGGMLWSKATEIAEDILGMIHPQPQQEWSEEDEEMLDNVEDSIASDETITDEELNERVAWVRFLVQRIKNTNY